MARGNDRRQIDEEKEEKDKDKEVGVSDEALELVDEDEDDRHRDDRRDGNECERDAGALKDGEIEEHVRELDEWIARRDRRAARAAAAGEDEVTQNRDVVVRANRSVAPRAMAGRKDDRFVTRIAMDDDVEKAADHRADGEGVEGEEDGEFKC